MIKKCLTCAVYYDDEYRLTICPHEAFLANDGTNNFTVHEDSYLSCQPPSEIKQLTDIIDLIIDEETKGRNT